jgi:hypothetical protein
MKRTKGRIRGDPHQSRAGHLRQYDQGQRTRGRFGQPLFSIWGVHSSNLSNPEIRTIQAEWEP